MPIPEPRGKEEKNDFISRCISSEIMQKEFPDAEQRKAVCYKQWRKNHSEEDDMKTIDIKGQPVMATGNWKGYEYTEEDLDKMLTAFKELAKSESRNVPLKLWHEDGDKVLEESSDEFRNERDGKFSIGWITNLYKKGKKLFADISNIPKKVAELASEKGGALKGLSPEIFHNYKDKSTGKIYPFVLDAVATLGSEAKAIRTLDDLWSLYHKEETEIDDSNTIKLVMSEAIIHAEKKTDSGDKYPKGAYLYIGDPDKVSTWKIRIWETPDKKVTVKQLGAAAASISSGGFRGNRADLPKGGYKKVAKKLIQLYRKKDVGDKEIPQHLFSTAGMKTKSQEDNMDKEKLKELNEELSEKDEELKTYKEKFEELEKENEEKEEKLSELEKENRKKEVESYIEEHKEKVIPAIKPHVKELLLCDVEEKLTFSEDGETVERSISETMKDMIDNLPEVVNLSEETVHNEEKKGSSYTEDGDEIENEDIDRKIKSYMKEHDVDYAEADKKLREQEVI